MNQNSNLVVLQEPLLALNKLMKELKCPWMLIGGIAVSLLSKPRFTADIDLVIIIDNDDVDRIVRIAKKYTIQPRIKEAIPFAQKNRVLLLRHTASSINIDISLGMLPYEIEAISCSKQYKIGKVSYNLPRVEDLIILKAVAHRTKDMLDIRELVNTHKKLNVHYIQKTIKEFAGVLEMPEIWDDIESIVRKKN